MKQLPVRVKILDVDEDIRTHHELPVTSTFIMDPATGKFDIHGLFSEHIFGEIGSRDRLTRFGYINLNATILDPTVYTMLIDMDSLFISIMDGTTYARFDEVSKTFVKASSLDKGADTGYAFFMKHVEKLRFVKNESISRTERIGALEANRGSWTITKFLVCPAGIRDYQIKDGRGKSGEINTFYHRLVEVCSTLEQGDTDSPIFDSVRFSIQRTVVMVMEYLRNLLADKNGFMQKSYAARSVALATRNVLVATDIDAPEDNPGAALKPTEVFTPLLQAIYATMPLFKYYLKTIFFQHIFDNISDQVSLIDPKTFALQYVKVPMKERTKFIASDKIVVLLEHFKDAESRHDPMSVVGVDGVSYYLYLIYDDPTLDTLYVGRSKSEFTEYLTPKLEQYDPEHIRPMTYYEIFYMAGMTTCAGKHITLTRYPVTSHLSIFPGEIHLATTTSFQHKKVKSIASDADALEYFRWPELHAASINGISMHPVQLKNLNADHDGDMGNSTALLSNEANKECSDYMKHPRFVVDPSGAMSFSLDSDLAQTTLFNLTRPRS